MEIQETSNIPALMDGLNALPQGISQSLSDAAQNLRLALKQQVENNLSGQILQSKSGRLLQSVEDEQADSEQGTHAEMYVSDDVPYAAILEYGGQTKAHIIQASQAKVLAFMGNSKQMFAPYVNHPGSAIPEFAYMRSALDALQDDITAQLTDSVSQPLASLT